MQGDSGQKLVINQRDVDVMVMVYVFDGVTVDQVRSRFWPTDGARSACYDRVARLTRSQYLTNVRLPSLTGQGSGKAFLTIGPRAYPLLAERLELSRAELNHVKQSPAPLFVAHHVAIVDFRLSLETACEGVAVVSLQDWTSERELKRAPFRVKDPMGTVSIVLVPDGAFTLELADGSAQSFYLEMDMGTLAPKRFRAKLRGYLMLAKQQPTPILFVVPDQRRQAQIASWAIDEAQRLSADPTIFWLTTRESITEQTVLAQPICQVVGGPSAHPLVPDAVLPEPLSSLPAAQLVYYGATR